MFMKDSTLKLCAMLLAFCTSAIHLQAMDEWDGTTIAKGFYSGTGTKTDPYRIYTFFSKLRTEIILVVNILNFAMTSHLAINL